MTALSTDIEITLSQHGWEEVEEAANAAIDFRLEHHGLSHSPSEEIATIARRASAEAEETGGCITRKMDAEKLEDCLTGRTVSDEVDAVHDQCLKQVALLDEELRLELEDSPVRG